MHILIDAHALIDAARPAEVSIVRTPAATVIVIAAAGGELPAVMPLEDAARAVGCSSRVLREAIARGRLVASGSERTRVVRREDLLAWIDSRRVRVRSGDDELEARATQIASEGAK